MDVTWLKKNNVKRSERFFYTFPSGRVEEPLLFPLLCYKENSEFYLLDGWKRLSLPLEEFPVVFWDSSEKTPSEALQLSIMANMVFRGLNSVEKGNIAHIILTHFNENAGLFAHLLNLNESDLRILSRTRALNNKLKEMIVRWKIPPKWLLKICENPEDWNVIWNYLQRIKITSSQMVWIIDSLYELSHRMQTTPLEIFKKTDGFHSFENLKKKIEKIRFPISSRYIEIIQTLQNEYQDSNFKIMFPENFEGDELSFQIKLKSTEDLTNLKKKIIKLFTDEKLNEIMELL